MRIKKNKNIKLNIKKYIILDLLYKIEDKRLYECKEVSKYIDKIIKRGKTLSNR